MSRLLLYVDDEQVDQILMVVPDNWDQKTADEEAEQMLSADAYLAETFEIDDDRAPLVCGEYRCYVG